MEKSRYSILATRPLKSIKLLIVVHHHFDLWNVPSWFPERLRTDFPQIEVTHRTNYDGVGEYLRDSEIVFAFSLRPEQFRLAKRLRWIHAPTAAVHQLLFPELVTSDVVLTNAHEVHAPVVAEHVIALIFALAKKIPQAARLQQERIWGQDAMWNDGPRPREVAGATLGLIGLGSIGRRVAGMAPGVGNARNSSAGTFREREARGSSRGLWAAATQRSAGAIGLCRGGRAAYRGHARINECRSSGRDAVRCVF